MKLQKIALLMIVVGMMSSLVWAGDVNVGLVVPSTVSAGVPFQIDLSLNSNNLNVKSFEFWITSSSGNVVFSAGDRSGDSSNVWFSGRTPTRNEVTSLSGKSAYVLNIGPDGSNVESTTTLKKVITLTATASAGDSIIIYQPNVQTKVSAYPLGNHNVIAPGPVGFTLAPSCIPTTCAAKRTTCGSISDECGDTLNCGACSAGTTCSAGSCIATTCADGSQCCPSEGVNCLSGNHCLRGKCTTLLTDIGTKIEDDTNYRSILQKISEIARRLRDYFSLEFS